MRGPKPALRVGKPRQQDAEETWLVVVKCDGSEECLEIDCLEGAFLKVMREKGYEPHELTYERVLVSAVQLSETTRT